MPNALVLQAAGINCDRETARAFELAGAQADLRHINELATLQHPFDDYDLLAIPGGFSFGDDVAAGRILGDRLARGFGDHVRRFIEKGRPVIGICNGFQTLASSGLLGGSCALDDNAGAAFVCRWSSLVRGRSPCVWLRNWQEDEVVELPIAHAEGRVVFADEAATSSARAAVTYVAPSRQLSADMPPNPNGSVGNIAGLCDASGLMLGLMPHPERFVEPMQHPAYQRQRIEQRDVPEPAGLRMFRAAVDYVRS